MTVTATTAMGVTLLGATFIPSATACQRRLPITTSFVITPVNELFPTLPGATFEAPTDQPRHVGHHRGVLADGRELVLADVPGSGEVDGSVREQLARDEALRAHAVVYVAASDLTRAQDAELGWLASFGKPLLLVLNKADQFRDDQRAELLSRLRERYAGRARTVLTISAGGSERYERTLADGRREKVERERTPDIAALQEALVGLTARGAAAWSSSRPSSFSACSRSASR